MKIGNVTWDEQSKHYYYTGIDAVALYVWDGSWYGAPNAWNGVTAINEAPSGAESNKLYADNIEYLNLLSKEEFGLTLECYQTPKDVYDNDSQSWIKGFDACDGIKKDDTGLIKVRGQTRATFGLVYRVLKGSDTVEAGGAVAGNTKGNGYIYHVVYGCKASPSSRDFATVNDSPEAQTMSFEITTTPLTDTTKLPTSSGTPLFTSVAHLEIDGSKLGVYTGSGTPTNGTIQALEAALFGGSSMPDPKAIATACGYTSN